MTRDETRLILAVLKVAYPSSFKGMTVADATTLLNLWERLFANDKYEAVAAAVDALIATRTVGYTPTPGEVKDQMSRIRNAEELDAGTAWALVAKACRNGSYGYREEFQKLPPEIQRAVGAPEQLRAWALMEEETVNSVVASNFMKTYRAQRERQKETEKLPETVKTFISGMTLKQIEE